MSSSSDEGGWEGYTHNESSDQGSESEGEQETHAEEPSRKRKKAPAARKKQKRPKKMKKAGGKKPKDMKPIKDPNHPKRNKSAYLFFCEVERPKMAADTTMSFGEIGKELGNRWKEISDKRIYEEMARVDKARYDEEMDHYVPPPVRYMQVGGKKKKKDANAPKKGKSAYLFFCEEERPKLLEGTDMSFGEVGKELGRRWKHVSESTKSKYKRKAIADKARYQNAMLHYVPTPGTLQDAKRRRKRDPNLPKKNKSAYLFFCEVERPKLVARNTMSFGEIGKELGVMWKNMLDRSRFEQMALADKNRYEAEMAQYRR